MASKRNPLRSLLPWCRSEWYDRCVDAGSPEPKCDYEPLGPFRLRTADGKYLAHTETGFATTAEKERAATFETEYGQHQTEEILKVFAAELGTRLTIDELTELERFEFCDACGQFARPVDVFFNGKAFLCHHCQARGADRKTDTPARRRKSSDASAP